jgi:hypothetical protein
MFFCRKSNSPEKGQESPQNARRVWKQDGNECVEERKEKQGLVKVETTGNNQNTTSKWVM